MTNWCAVRLTAYFAITRKPWDHIAIKITTLRHEWILQPMAFSNWLNPFLNTNEPCPINNEGKLKNRFQIGSTHIHSTAFPHIYMLLQDARSLYEHNKLGLQKHANVKKGPFCMFCHKETVDNYLGWSKRQSIWFTFVFIPGSSCSQVTLNLLCWCILTRMEQFSRCFHACHWWFEHQWWMTDHLKVNFIGADFSSTSSFFTDCPCTA